MRAGVAMCIVLPSPAEQQRTKATAKTATRPARETPRGHLFPKTRRGAAFPFSSRGNVTSPTSKIPIPTRYAIPDHVGAPDKTSARTSTYGKTASHAETRRRNFIARPIDRDSPEALQPAPARAVAMGR